MYVIWHVNRRTSFSKRLWGDTEPEASAMKQACVFLNLRDMFQGEEELP